MQAPSPARIHYGITLPPRLDVNCGAWPIGLEKAYRAGRAIKSGFRRCAAGLLNRIGTACMGWLTVLLVAIAVLGLIGTSWVPFARR